ncbi:MAG: NAD-dependent epimerase/dehydratase family protein [Syntrophomonadaceae bacterium]
MTKVLVTGGAGFIGSHVVDALISLGHEAVVIDNLTAGKLENIHKKAKLYPIDINDNKLGEIFTKEKPDYVIHLAAQTQVTKSITNPRFDAEVNINGTISLLQQCALHRTKKLIYSSSGAVYGHSQRLPIKEEEMTRPVSFYGLSKYAAEQYIQLFGVLYELDYTILRYSNVYGLRQNPHGESGVLAIYINNLLKNRDLIVHGDGEQTRDFIFVKDVARANLQALHYGSREIINISSNTGTSINQLISKLNALIKNKQKIIYGEERPGDIKHSRLDNDKARRLLHWEPAYSLVEGLKETIDYVNSSNLSGSPLA